MTDCPVDRNDSVNIDRDSQLDKMTDRRTDKPETRGAYYWKYRSKVGREATMLRDG